MKTLKGSLSVLKLMPGTNFNQTGKPLQTQKTHNHNQFTTQSQKKNPDNKWNVPEIPFGTNIRTNAKISIESSFLNCLNEFHKIISSFKIVLKLNYMQNKR